MLFKNIILFSSVLWIVCNISIPLSPMQSRCMIGYTYDEDENLKMDVTLPPIPEQKPNESYQISIFNTETHETSYESISNGVFRK